MRPDDRRRGRQPDAQNEGPVPFDLASDPNAEALAALERELAASGQRLRAERATAGPERPRAGFVADLRTHLVASYPTVTQGRSSGHPTLAGLAVARPMRRTVADAAATPRPNPLAGLVIDRLAGFLPARRFAVLAAAAAVVVAILGTSAGRPFPGPVDTQATDTIGATLIRDGNATPLVAGMALRPRDEVRVGSDGRATLHLGSSLTRLDAGADVRLDDLAADQIRLELLGGRTYHRVSLPAGGSYVVATGPLTWTALGTVFDLDRAPLGDGRERVDELGLQHAVAVDGPDLRTSVAEGRTASVILGPAAGDASDLAVGAIDPARLDDPWLIANARADRALGLPLGVLDRLALGPTPSPAATDGPTEPTPTGDEGTTAEASAAAPPRPTDHPTTTPTEAPTHEPTPKPTPKPKPKPTLELGLLGCDGGVIVDWSAYAGGGFDHYLTLRNRTASIPKAYPPQAGAVAVHGTYGTVRTRTDAHDPTADGGSTVYYRTMALDASDRVLAASPVRAVTTSGIGDLGALEVGPSDAAKTGFRWSPYSGPGDCFTVQKLVYSKFDPSPSYFSGATVLFLSTEQGVAETIAELPSGMYHFRLQVLRQTTLGAPARFLVAQTDVATYTVP